MIKRNAALREGVILRGLIVGAYVCFELIGRNFLLRAYMKGSNESAEVLMVMGASLLIVQFLILPMLQKRYSPKTLLQLAIVAKFICYGSTTFTTNLNQYLFIIFIQTGAYAVCYAETCTMITR
jgi:Na+/melibiose symporter-like transporter